MSVRGSELKKRAVRIMRQRITQKLDLSRKLMLNAARVMVVVVPIVFGLVSTSQVLAQLLEPKNMPLPSFEVASIRPNSSGATGSRFNREGDRLMITATTKNLIQNAFNAQTDNQILGGPSWINSEEYDINAKIENSVFEELRKLPHERQEDQVKFMMQALLMQRFKLKVSYVTKQLPVYALVVAKNGPKLTPSASPTKDSGLNGTNTEDKGTNTPIGMLADELSRHSEVGGRPVIDETGLKGQYDWTLKWSPDENTPMFKGRSDIRGGAANSVASDAAWPSLFTAIQEQLGLKLERRKGPVRVLIISHIERPSEN